MLPRRLGEPGLPLPPQAQRRFDFAVGGCIAGSTATVRNGGRERPQQHPRGDTFPWRRSILGTTTWSGARIREIRNGVLLDFASPGSRFEPV